MSGFRDAISEYVVLGKPTEYLTKLFILTHNNDYMPNKVSDYDSGRGGRARGFIMMWEKREREYYVCDWKQLLRETLILVGVEKLL